MSLRMAKVVAVFRGGVSAILEIPEWCVRPGTTITAPTPGTDDHVELDFSGFRGLRPFFRERPPCATCGGTGRVWTRSMATGEREQDACLDCKR